ncbi:MAG: protein-tyrosine phosphatase family protein [Acidobacteriota bacterium]
MLKIDWILQGSLAGSAQPGLLAPLDEDADQLKRFGFGLIVDLTESQPSRVLEDAGFEVIGFPIPDMGVPTPRDMAAVARQVLEKARLGVPCLVHCKAGLGRTGTFLASCLVLRGVEPSQAITDIRLVNRRFIQNRVQEMFVSRFADFVASEAEDDRSEPEQT